MIKKPFNRRQYHANMTRMRQLRNPRTAPRDVPEVKISVEPPSASELPWPEADVVVFSSPHERCGVGEYGRALSKEMRQDGRVVYESRLDALGLLARAPAGARVLVHAEPSLMPKGFDEAFAEASENGATTVVCFHYCDVPFLQRFETHASALVVHRHYVRRPKIVEIPLACPVYDPPDRAKLRERFRLPQRGVVLSTAGFLSPWKKIPDIVERLLPHLGRDLFLQLNCATHYSGDSGGELTKLKRIIGTDARVSLVSDFLPTEELLDRAHAADLGFVYHGAHTGSVSAATKTFVAARCPLVLTESTHSSDVNHGTEHVPGLDMGVFVDRLLTIARDPKRLGSMREEVEREYARLNMRRVASQYLELFERLS